MLTVRLRRQPARLRQWQWQWQGPLPGLSPSYISRYFTHWVKPMRGTESQKSGSMAIVA
jgi:hypothetical protein